MVLSSQAALLTEKRDALNAEYDAIARPWKHWTAPIPPCKTASPPLWAAGPQKSLPGSQTAGTAASFWIVHSTCLPKQRMSASTGMQRFLSAGAADQLYLAVRLAICDLVLPQENCVPIVLDDALTNFDDERCASALRYLKEAAQTRQILLFTCHSREADFLPMTQMSLSSGWRQTDVHPHSVKRLALTEPVQRV